MNLKIISLIALIVITSSVQHICVPILVTYFESLYFIIMATSFEGCINYAIVLLILTKGRFALPKNYKLVALAGVFNALMSLCFIYSSNPQRTPVVIQSIFLGFTVFPTVLLRRLFLHKIIIYNKIYISASILFLMISVGVASYPLYDSTPGGDHNKLSMWIAGYLGAVFFLSIDNVMQEKYVITTNDGSVTNKITFAFYTSICQFCTLILFCWVEFVFGYTNTPIESFARSAIAFVHNPYLLLLFHFFIYDCLILYLISINLNAISTNYNMILTNLTTQSVAIFFTIFPQLNNGLKYELHITLISLICNSISVILWITGEKNVTQWQTISEHPEDESYHADADEEKN
jgi:hypothetical protein